MLCRFGGVARQQFKGLIDCAEHALTREFGRQLAGLRCLVIVVGILTEAFVHELHRVTENLAGLVERNGLTCVDARLQCGQRRKNGIARFALGQSVQSRHRTGDVRGDVAAHRFAITANLVDVEVGSCDRTSTTRRTRDRTLGRIIVGFVVIRFIVIRFVGIIVVSSGDADRRRRWSVRACRSCSIHCGLDRPKHVLDVSRLDALTTRHLGDQFLNLVPKLLLHRVGNRRLGDPVEDGVQLGAQFGEPRCPRRG